jgi:FtsH-binding integral membrane protein
MGDMSDPKLPHGQLPQIPDGCGILPIAENRIARGPHPEVLDLLPPGYARLDTMAESSDSQLNDAPLNDALEQSYRRVLARALALAACALLLIAAVAFSRVQDSSFQGAASPDSFLPERFLTAQLIFRVVLLIQVLFTGFCSRYVEKLSIAPAAIFLLGYAGFCALEFSALLPPAALAVAFLCAGLMYAVTALWGLVRRCDLARPSTGVFMILAGGVILAAVNRLLHSSNFSWSLSSLAVVVFAGLASYYAQQIRDFYQDFDDDNAEGWKASVLGALLLLVNSVNLYLLVATFRPRVLDDKGDDSGRSRS